MPRGSLTAYWCIHTHRDARSVTICLHLCNTEPFAIETQRRICLSTAAVTAVTAGVPWLL